MLSIRLVYIYLLLYIIFITLCFTINIVISKKEDIIPNTNKIALIAIIILILFVFYNIYIYKPEKKNLTNYNFIIKKINNLPCDCKEKHKEQKCLNKKQFSNNYQNFLHSEYIDELENELFYKSKDDYHNIEKYIHENYLSNSK
jgi:hypothetical protein